MFREWLMIAPFVAALVAACTTTSDVGTIDDAMREDYVPLDEEIWAIEQADLFHSEFLEQGLLYDDPTINHYLESIEHRLLHDRDNLKTVVHLFVLKSPTPNAIAWPNGNIYINSGLFAALESEDQLAAIISHEIAHISQKHSVKAVISQKNTLIGAHIGDLATGGFGVVYFGAFANIMHFSREQEQQADEIGLKRLAESGYDPNALLEAFNKLAQYPELKHQKRSIYSSHPSMTARAHSIELSIRALPQAPGARQTPDDTFETLKAKLMEDSLKIRLRNREFQLALRLLQEATDYFGETSRTAFYRGESHFGLYRYPKDAARELYWIKTGEYKLDEKTMEIVKANREKNLEAAQRSFYEAIVEEPIYPKALRRLGEIQEAQGNYSEAKAYYASYLEQVPEASDRRYVERAMKRINGANNGDIP